MENNLFFFFKFPEKNAYGGHAKSLGLTSRTQRFPNYGRSLPAFGLWVGFSVSTFER